MAVKGILDHSIKASWTLFIIIFSFLILVLVRVWVTVGFMLQGDPIYIEGDFIAPKVITKVEPVYPEQAKKNRITGEILLDVQTDRRGNVVRTKVLNVAPSFEDGFGIWRLYIAAREAVSQWTFKSFIFTVEGERLFSLLLLILSRCQNDLHSKFILTL